MVSRIRPAVLELNPPAVTSTAAMCRRISLALALVEGLETDRLETAVEAKAFTLHRERTPSGTSLTLTHTKG